MQVLAPEELTGGPSAVTIGAYDGVHLGHRRLLRRLSQGAAERGIRTAVVTFDRHPATVVRPESAPLLLTDPEQKLELLDACGIDLAVVVTFDRQRADETAEDFVDEVLVRALGTRLVVVGEDFHFGHGRKGNVALLEELGREHGFEVEGVPLATDGASGAPGGGPGAGEPTSPVSSTRIRALVAAGDVATAAALLDRPHEVRGTVVAGDGRGGPVLGFPTANVAVPPGMAVPAIGIYAGWFRRPDGSRHVAAISVGRRPTFHDDQEVPVVEAHLLDFDDDLYGERAGVAFAARLRDERRFDRVEDLVAQMREDIAAIRGLLG